MKVFFLGATKFSHRCYQAVLDSGQEIVGCAGTPEVFQISYAKNGVKNVNYCDFREVARRHDVPCVPYTRDNPRQFTQEVAALQPDILLAAGWYYMVAKGLRNTAPKGALGLHGSLLPKYRGGAPLVWQMIHGEPQAGMSLFYLEDGVDTGPVVGQRSFPIDENDTITNVLEKAEDAAIELLHEYLPRLAAGTAPRIEQDESQATEFPQRCPDDGEIDWSQPAETIRNFIRAQTRPYPGAFTRIGGKKVTIWDADILENEAQQENAA